MRLCLNTVKQFSSTSCPFVNKSPTPPLQRCLALRVAIPRAGRLALAGLLIATLPLACASPPPDAAASPAPEDEAERWFEGRIDSLKADDGWLTLVGLLWLSEGRNTFGSAGWNDLVFPVADGADAMGTFVRTGTSVRIEVSDGIPITHQGELVSSMSLTSSPEGPPTLLRLATLTFHLIQRGDRIGLRLRDTTSEARLGFRDIQRFRFAPQWRFLARFEPHPAGTTLSVPNILGDVNEEISPGKVVFDLAGRSYSLAALEGSSGTLFLVFGDETNGSNTYAGGRFLYTEPPRGDGTVVVDFNRSYNPPCAFTPWATCPLPPLQNRLALEIQAGELAYEAH